MTDRPTAALILQDRLPRHHHWVPTRQIQGEGLRYESSRRYLFFYDAWAWKLPPRREAFSLLRCAWFTEVQTLEFAQGEVTSTFWIMIIDSARWWLHYHEQTAVLWPLLPALQI